MWELRGLRIDALDELIDYHRLDKFLQRTGIRQKPRPDWGPDPRLAHLRNAVRLVREADALRRSEKYRSANEKCVEALSLAPDYGGAFLQRSKIYLYFLGDHWQELTAEDRGRYADFAYELSYRAATLCPEWNEARLIHAQNILYAVRFNSDPDGFQTALDLIENMLRNDWVDPLTIVERSYANNLRAQCFQFLGKMENARKNYEEFGLAPAEAQWYLNRAQFWQQQGQVELERADRETARLLRSKRAAPLAPRLELDKR